MQQIDFKTRFLGLAMGTIAASGSLLTACSTHAQNQAQAPSAAVSSPAANRPTDANHQPGMNHGGRMDHGRMDLGPADAEFDLRFIDSMIPHHEGAVIMAKEVLQKSKRPELRQLAENVIKAQAQEINQMRQWRATWYPKAPGLPVAWHAQMGHSMAMSADQLKAMRMERDLGAADTDFDKRFIEAMIPHHEGAVTMAKDALQKAKHPEIVQMAKAIVASQQAEIDQMQQWRKTWYGQ